MKLGLASGDLHEPGLNMKKIKLHFEFLGIQMHLVPLEVKEFLVLV